MLPLLRDLRLCLDGARAAGLDDDDEPDNVGVDEEYEKSYPKRQDPRDYLSKRSPEEVFDEFDQDGSGQLDQDEFFAMLPALGIMVR